MQFSNWFGAHSQRTPWFSIPEPLAEGGVIESRLGSTVVNCQQPDIPITVWSEIWIKLEPKKLGAEAGARGQEGPMVQESYNAMYWANCQIPYAFCPPFLPTIFGRNSFWMCSVMNPPLPVPVACSQIGLPMDISGCGSAGFSFEQSQSDYQVTRLRLQKSQSQTLNLGITVTVRKLLLLCSSVCLPQVLHFLDSWPASTQSFPALQICICPPRLQLLID